MSWSDPYSSCGKHIADCNCGDWCGYNSKKNISELEKNLLEMKAWNDRRAETEKRGIEKFYKLLKMLGS